MMLDDLYSLLLLASVLYLFIRHAVLAKRGPPGKP